MINKNYIYKTIFFITVIIISIATSSYDKIKQPKSALIYTFYYNDHKEKVINDSIVVYYDNQNRIIKHIEPAYRRTYKDGASTKYSTTTRIIQYNKKGKIASTYSYDGLDKESLIDSTSFIYSNNLLIKKYEYKMGRKTKPFKYEYKYKNGILISEEENNYDRSYIEYKYPRKDSIIRIKYVDNKKCITNKIKILSKYDTINDFKFHSLCGYKSDNNIHTKYNKHNKLIEKNVNGNSEYYFYYKNLLTSMCNDSICQNCIEKYEYTFDKYGNWITKTTKSWRYKTKTTIRKLKY